MFGSLCELRKLSGSTEHDVTKCANSIETASQISCARTFCGRRRYRVDTSVFSSFKTRGPTSSANRCTRRARLSGVVGTDLTSSARATRTTN